MNGRLNSLRNTIWPLFGMGLAILANVSLFARWQGWSVGPWADCPFYAFSMQWYPVPPLIVVFVPLGISFAGLALSAVGIRDTIRNKSYLPIAINGLGIILNTLPLLATTVLPAISDALGKTAPGC